MHRRQLLLLRFLLAASDLILLNMCLFVGFYLSNKYGNHINLSIYYNSILPVSIIWILSTGLFKLYDEYTIYTLKDICRSSWRSILFHAMAFPFFIFFEYSDFPRYFLFAFYALVTGGFVLSRIIAMRLESLMMFNFEDREANILAIASKGGHWIELLRLMPLFEADKVTFISNTANLEDTVKGHKFHIVPDANKDDKLDLIKCSMSVFWYVLISRPEVIITTGAAPGLLGILMGRIFGVKTIWVDSIANVEKLSLSGNIALRIADRVYTQWEHLSSPKVIFSGNVL